MKPDYSRLTPDLQDKLKKWEANTPAAKQLVVLEDVASIMQEVLRILDSGQKRTDQQGSLLMDIREVLQALNTKETPESPDYAKPIVAALKRLERAVATIEVKPGDMPAPQVQVDTPEVNVDLSGVERVLRTMPAAFKSAIALIPKTEVPESDYSPVVEKLNEMLDRLLSLENATRMKPLPGSIKVSNLDDVTTELEQMNTQYASFLFDPSDAAPTYIGKNVSAVADNNQNDWVIYKFIYSGSDVTDIRKKTGSWSSRAALF